MRVEGVADPGTEGKQTCPSERASLWGLGNHTYCSTQARAEPFILKSELWLHPWEKTPPLPPANPRDGCL